jgi:hypothetical protein
MICMARLDRASTRGRARLMITQRNTPTSMQKLTQIFTPIVTQIQEPS